MVETMAETSRQAALDAIIERAHADGFPQELIAGLRRWNATRIDAAIAAEIPRALARFRSGLGLLAELTRRREHALEIILVASCYLDAIAGLLYDRPLKHGESFARLLRQHSGLGDFYGLVSVPDLYAFVMSCWWEVPGLQRRRKGGQLRAVCAPGDMNYDYYKFLKDSGLDRSKPSLDGFLLIATEVLESVGKCRPYQRTQHPMLVPSQKVWRRFLSQFDKRGNGVERAAARAFRPVINHFTLAGILWYEYRNVVVHTAVAKDPPDSSPADPQNQRFYTARRPFFLPSMHYLTEYPVLGVVIPAPFLVRTVRGCLASCRRECLKRIPEEILLNVYARQLKLLVRPAIGSLAHARLPWPYAVASASLAHGGRTAPYEAAKGR